MYDHEDILKELDRNIPVGKKLEYVHNVLKRRFDCVDRVAVAIYDPKTDLLRTFVDSSQDDQPLDHYSAGLVDSRTLREVLKQRRPRVVNDLQIFAGNSSEHTQKILERGYQSSYTMPMFLNSVFFGFIFFNSCEKNSFNEGLLHYLDLIGHLISLVIINEISAVHTLLVVLKTARDMTHFRDTETGAHLDRMSRYAEIVAQELADKYKFKDEFIEHILVFAPLHDIGKIVIPNNILLKQGKLTGEEWEIMKSHSAQGRQMIDDLLNNFGLENFQYLEVLRNIAQHHHEAWDGTGYPRGLKGDEIPIEARIVAVADVFDALTSRRPYKSPLSNDEAFATLQRLADHTLDKDCVEALDRRRADVEQIQSRIQEDQWG